jgi:hypothetical protein
MKAKFILFICIWIFSCLVLAQAQSSPVVTKLTSLGLNSLEKMKPNGAYTISIRQGNKWKEAGRLSFDRFLREREIDLSGFTPMDDDQNLIVRINQTGGGAAHIDSVFIGNQPPKLLRNINTQQILKKLSHRDMDVIEATRKSFEMVFPTRGTDKKLRLTARVENRIILTTPFQFPQANLYRSEGRLAKFYRYKLGRNSVLPDRVNPAEYIKTIGSRPPFFKVFSPPISGHPPGFTYGWVSNDKNNLYVTLDFTSDNTCDGDKDYAKVFIQVPKGIKQYKITVDETKWGNSYFTYTDKVSYQHKVYNFVIPFSEFDPTGKRDELKLAFAAYGTSVAMTNPPALAFDAQNNRYLLVYSVAVPGVVGTAIYGQLVNPDGTPFGVEFLIADPPGAQINPQVAYGNLTCGFLVVWQDGRNIPGEAGWDIYARRVSLSGTPVGSEIAVSTHTGGQLNPDVAYDSRNQRFLVVWDDERDFISSNIDIYGQLVNSDGTLFPTPAESELTIYSGIHSQISPAVAYDSLYSRFLVAYNYGGIGIIAQMVNDDGSLYGTPVTVSDPADSDRENPAVAYDSFNHRFLVSWNEWIVGTPTFFDIFGQLVDAGGQRYPLISTPNFLISFVPEAQELPAVAFNQLNRYFLAIWNDNRNFSSIVNPQVYSQAVDSEGSLLFTAMDENILVEDIPALGSVAPALAYNSLCNNFLAVWSSWYPSSYPGLYAAIIGPPCPDLPSVTTTAVTQITGNSAVSGGHVTADGGAEVTGRGVCWNATGQPALSDSHTEDGSGTGIFSSLINGLSGDTVYHVRAYATNRMGTAYGNELTFETLPDLRMALTVSRLTEGAWIIHRDYGSLDLMVENPQGVVVDKFIIYRKANNGSYNPVKEFFQTELQNGLFHFNDQFLDSGIDYTYKVVALDSMGMVVGISNDVTI